MTTLIPFNPAPNANFQFQCTLDGAPYNVICKFNAYGQRYYVYVYDLNGTLVFSRPLIASPSFFNVSLTLGYFDTTMIYRETSASFEIPGLPAVPMTRPPRPAYVPPAPPPPGPPGPLDPYSFGITFAYGRQRLLGTYSGPLYRVRRSGDNAEQDILAGSDGTDTVSLTAFVGSQSAYLVTWYDQSGAHVDLLQPTAAKQPQVVSAGTVFQNFHPDGVNDGLTSTVLVPSSVAASMYYTGLIYAGTETSVTPITGGVDGVKYAFLAYAILSGSDNNGLLPGLGTANGNSYDPGDVDKGYTVIFNTAGVTFDDQIKIVSGDHYAGFHGETPPADNSPISAGPTCYGHDAADSSLSHGRAQLRAMVGYNLAHDLATATAINTILAA